MERGRIKMLVADDDKDMCQVISDIFKGEGEEVTTAYDGETVLARAKELGAYAFLDKPFDINRLVRLVQRAQASQS